MKKRARNKQQRQISADALIVEACLRRLATDPGAKCATCAGGASFQLGYYQDVDSLKPLLARGASDVEMHRFLWKKSIDEQLVRNVHQMHKSEYRCSACMATLTKQYMHMPRAGTDAIANLQASKIIILYRTYGKPLEQMLAIVDDLDSVQEVA